MAPSDPAAMQATVDASPRRAKYAESIDRESAREKLAARLEEGARKQAEEDAAAEAAKDKPASKKAPSRRTEKKDDGGVISDVVGSSAFKDFMRTAAREIARGMFKTGRR
jgi:hypothetical protein